MYNVRQSTHYESKGFAAQCLLRVIVLFNPILYVRTAELMPGYYATAVNGSEVTGAEVCPHKYYCSGGAPVQPFNPSNPASRDPADTTVVPCDDGMWTQTPGATSSRDCSECRLLRWQSRMLHYCFELTTATTPNSAQSSPQPCFICPCFLSALQ